MNKKQLEPPSKTLFFEDYVIGVTQTFGNVAISEEMIIEFANLYDPQFFHTDPTRAKDSIYEGLIASGWHTTAIMMRELTFNYISDVSSLGSPGIKNLRWIEPVRPNDILSFRTTIKKTRRSSSKPDRGIVESLIEVLNQEKKVVMDLNVTNFIACRT